MSDYDDSGKEYSLDDGEGSTGCPFSVTATGLPAVSRDGRRFAYWMANVLAKGMGDEAFHVLRIVDIDSGAETSRVAVVSGAPIRDEECRAAWQGAKDRGRDANGLLDALRWRPLVRLQLPVHHHGELDEDGSRARRLARPAAERPVELTIQQRHVVLRVPKVKVLGRSRQAVVEEGDGRDCRTYQPRLGAVFADRRANLLVVQVHQDADDGHCAAQTLVHPIELQPGALDAIERRNGWNE